MTSVLISNTFDDEDASRRVFARLHELHDAALLNLTGLARIYVAKDGHLEITTSPHDPVASQGEKDVVSFAQILGSLLAEPLLGRSVDGTAAAVVDRIADDEETTEKRLLKQAARILEPGKWSVVGYATQVAESAVRSELSEDAPDLLVWEIDDTTANGLSDGAGMDS